MKKVVAAAIALFTVVTAAVWLASTAGSESEFGSVDVAIASSDYHTSSSVNYGHATSLTDDRQALPERQPVSDTKKEKAEVDDQRYKIHNPSTKEVKVYRWLNRLARRHGLVVPVELVGSGALWRDVVSLDELYRGEMDLVQYESTKRAFELAGRQDVSMLERLSGPRENPKLSKGERGVMIGRDDGTYLVRISAGQDLELDAIGDRLRLLELSCCEALGHILQDHGVK